MKDLSQVTVIGMGLLGASIALAVLHALPGVKVVGYSHRPSTRRKARRLLVNAEIDDSLSKSVSSADLVILATPISTFENILEQIAGSLPPGCIVTDVGSTKLLPTRWAHKVLPDNVHYVGSHPIAGSEQRGLEYARDDLLSDELCVLTATERTDRKALRRVRDFWSALGCIVKRMTPDEHDRIFANVSHLPYVMAVSLTNANTDKDLKCCGKGFIDTSRVASSPANIWADILVANSRNLSTAVGRAIRELEKLKHAVEKRDLTRITELLDAASRKRRSLISFRMKNKELLS